jgi:hypothetical protein
MFSSRMLNSRGALDPRSRDRIAAGARLLEATDEVEHRIDFRRFLERAGLFAPRRLTAVLGVRWARSVSKDKITDRSKLLPPRAKRSPPDNLDGLRRATCRATPPDPECSAAHFTFLNFTPGLAAVRELDAGALQGQTNVGSVSDGRESACHVRSWLSSPSPRHKRQRCRPATTRQLTRLHKLGSSIVICRHAY